MLRPSTRCWRSASRLKGSRVIVLLIEKCGASRSASSACRRASARSFSYAWQAAKRACVQLEVSCE